MKETLKTAMTTSISEVLETMFFMTIETPVGAVSVDNIGDRHYASKICFHGPLSGYFVFMVPKKVLSTMTETFMGLDTEDVTETHLSGTILEAINMVAGNTFSKFDDQAVFNLEIPELVDAVAISKNVGHTVKEQIFLRIDTPGESLWLQVLYSV